MTITYCTLDGRPVAPSAALDERGILRSGFKMRNNVLLMDGRSIPLVDGDAERRRAMWDEQKRKLSSAWRDPPPDAAADAKVRDAARAKIGDAYERHEDWLRNAWR